MPPYAPSSQDLRRLIKAYDFQCPSPTNPGRGLEEPTGTLLTIKMFSSIPRHGPCDPMLWNESQPYGLGLNALS